MKKLFASLAVAVMMFVAGVTLSACGSKGVQLNFSFDEKSEPLVKVVVKQNNEEIDGRGNSYNLEKGVNLRVEIVAKTYGVDFDEVVVKVNGLDRTASIIKNRNYDCSVVSQDLTYGNFTLANVDEKLNVSIAGAKLESVIYNFEIENAGDETAVANMRNAYIDANGDDTYTNLYDFVTNADNKIEREFSAENFNSFKLKFADPEKGDDIFDLLNSSAFKVRTASGAVLNASYSFASSGYYTVSFSGVKEKTNTIIINFKGLEYREYSVSIPEDNLNYSVTAPKSLNFNTEGIVSVTKSDKRASLVYDDVVVYINDKPLALQEGCDPAVDSVLNFVIPKGITPFSTSNYGEVYYTISVDGLSFNEESHNLTILQPATEDQRNMMTSKLFLLDDNGEKVGEIPEVNGSYAVAKSEKLALYWEYKFDNEKNCLVSKYDLFNFDVAVGDIIFKAEEIPSLADDEDSDQSGEDNPDQPEIPDEPNYEIVKTLLSLADKIDLTLKEDQVVTLADGYNLRVFYNEETERFDSMQLEFSCDRDKQIGFENLKTYSQEVNISYDFADAVVRGVEYRIDQQGEIEWNSIERNADKKIRIEAGQTIVFRLRGTAYVDATKFTIENQDMIVGEPIVSTYTQVGVAYTEFRFVVSNNQFAEMQNFKLVVKRG